MKRIKFLYTTCPYVWSKVSDFFVYDIWENLTDAYHNTKWFFRNLKVFWSTLWDWRPWDHSYAKDVYCMMLEQLARQIETGFEEKRSADKKVRAIRALIKELSRDIDDEVMTIMQEKHLPIEKVNQLRYGMMSHHITEISRMLRGQSPYVIDIKLAFQAENFEKEHGRKPTPSELYDMQVDLYDGTGVEGWWE